MYSFHSLTTYNVHVVQVYKSSLLSPVQPSLNEYKDDAPDQKGSEEKTQDENRAPSDDDKSNSPPSKKAKVSNGSPFHN